MLNWYNTTRDFVFQGGEDRIQVQQGKSLWFDGRRAHYMGVWYEGAHALTGAVHTGWLSPLWTPEPAPEQPSPTYTPVSVWEWLRKPAC